MRFTCATWVVISTCCVALSQTVQRTADVAYLETVCVKPGNNVKFENTLKRHWRWHEKQGETWSYLVWTVDSGENEGAYKILSLGHTWKEVDESNALVAATPPPEDDPGPDHETARESYYRYRPELSIASPTKQRLPLASVTYMFVKPEAVQEFVIALQRITKSFPDGLSKQPAQWYELVTGGGKPQFLLIEEHPDWASYRGSSELDAFSNGKTANQIPEETVKSFWNCVRSMYSETWHYRSELSRVVGSR